jgi:hypothetical protein
VHCLDRLRCLLFGCETDEREAARPSRVAIGGNVNVHHFADLAEQLAKILLSRAEVEVAYEYFV